MEISNWCAFLANSCTTFPINFCVITCLSHHLLVLEASNNRGLSRCRAVSEGIAFRGTLRHSLPMCCWECHTSRQCSQDQCESDRRGGERTDNVWSPEDPPGAKYTRPSGHVRQCRRSHSVLLWVVEESASRELWATDLQVHQGYQLSSVGYVCSGFWSHLLGVVAQW